MAAIVGAATTVNTGVEHLEIVEELRTQILECVSQIESEQVGKNVVDYVHRKLDQIWREVFQLTQVNVVNETALTCISDAIACLQRFDELELSTGYQSPLLNDGNTGRPKFNIPPTQLEFFLANGFTGTAIAAMLGVSLRTVRRRIAEHGLLKNVFRSAITDAELDDVVNNIMEQFPNIGYSRLEGELRRRNILIPRVRCRETLRKLDPVGVVVRLRSLCYRRKYSVYGPLALWHVDGNHKLIRYTCIQGVGMYYSIT